MFELGRNPIGYFGKMNSTLGSVAPLAMFSTSVNYRTTLSKLGGGQLKNHPVCEIESYDNLMIDRFLAPQVL